MRSEFITARRIVSAHAAVGWPVARMQATSAAQTRQRIIVPFPEASFATPLVITRIGCTFY
jgi:hypothetical protein